MLPDGLREALGAGWEILTDTNAEVSVDAPQNDRRGEEQGAMGVFASWVFLLKKAQAGVRDSYLGRDQPCGRHGSASVDSAANLFLISAIVSHSRAATSAHVMLPRL